MKKLWNIQSVDGRVIVILKLNEGYERCTCETKPRIAMAKAALNKKRALFTSKMDLELSEKVVKCYISSTALCGAETCTLRAPRH
jgi:hypothetical protein